MEREVPAGASVVDERPDAVVDLSDAPTASVVGMPLIAPDTLGDDIELPQPDIAMATDAAIAVATIRLRIGRLAYLRSIASVVISCCSDLDAFVDR